MKHFRTASFVILVAALIVPQGALAADTLVFATTGAKAWDSSVVEYGRRMGFFAEVGIEVEYAVGDNTGLNLQAVISGSADIAVVATHTFLAAAIQDAPVKMVSSAFRGASDFLWYVRSDNPLQGFTDITETTTIAVPSLGSSGYIILRTVLDQYGVNPSIIAVGSTAATLTQVVTGQVDIGSDGNGLLGVPQYASGEVRPIAFGREAEALRDVTVRGFVVSDATLAQRRDVIVRFLQTYKKTVDWMYRDPLAVQWFAEGTDTTVAEAARVREQSYPDGVIHVGNILGLDYSIKQGLKFKRIDRAPTEEELKKAFDIIWTPEAD